MANLDNVRVDVDPVNKGLSNLEQLVNTLQQISPVIEEKKRISIVLGEQQASPSVLRV